MENSMVKLLDLMRTGKKVMKENMSMGSWMEKNNGYCENEQKQF
jgi:hypothetical protein